MPPVARTDQQDIFAADLARKQDAVARDGITRLFQLFPMLKIRRARRADHRAVRCEFDPREVVQTVDFAHTRIVAFVQLFICQAPMYAVVAESRDQDLVARARVDAENTGESAAERHDRGVENAVGKEQIVTRNDGIRVVTPDGIREAFGLVLPGDIRDRIAEDVCHVVLSLKL